MREIALALGSPVTEFSELRALSTPGHLALSEEEHRHLESQHFAEFETKARRSSKLSRIPNSPEEHIEPSNGVIYPYARVTLEGLCDIPRFKVTATPWTELPMIATLFHIWFRSISRGIIPARSLLIKVSSSTTWNGTIWTQEFYTPLLVNSVLSVASVCRPCRYLL